MRPLNFDLKNLTRRNREGSFSTQACRARGLNQLANELHELGFKLKVAKNLAPKHINALVSAWKNGGIQDASIRNRLGWLRWWAKKIDKRGLLPSNNVNFGLQERRKFNGDKAKVLTAEDLKKVADDRIALALQLEAAFGLRREEALKMRPIVADKGNRIILQPSWTKGGRYREIPITHPIQRAVLDQVRGICGDGSLIGQGRNYIQALKHYENRLMRAGIRNAQATAMPMRNGATRRSLAGYALLQAVNL